jgi:predicted polyphosphate/ATP-dependent NAD kinase
MPAIGIVANPASGRDIRRLVSYATTIDNEEKVNIVKRIVLGAQSLGIDQFYFMPDTYQIGWAVEDSLNLDKVLTAKITLVDLEMEATADDSTKAAAMMRELGVGCIVVLGGDGTSRAVAKEVGNIPLLPISTGTNNVYPSMLEGTVAGMAAAAATQLPDPYKCCIHDKKLKIEVNGKEVDLALVDMVISNDQWVGSRAIWQTDNIRYIFVTRCHPASIGFSAVGGAITVISDTDDYGMALKLGESGKKIKAPVAAGVLSDLNIEMSQRMMLDQPFEFTVDEECMIALDGEREHRLHTGDTVRVTVVRDGPWRVGVKTALEQAVEAGMFRY